MHRKWHFWENRPCIHLFSIWPRSRQILRSDRPLPPPPFQLGKTTQVKEPVLFSGSMQTARELTKFWNTHYKTIDWNVHYTETDVHDMLQPSTVIGVRNPDGDLIATVASRPLDGTFVRQNEVMTQRFFEVDCLVLHPDWRGKGLAGWLLAWLDLITSREEPVIHTWMRESLISKQLPKRTIVPFARMHTAQLFLTSLSTRPHLETVQPLPWPTIRTLLHTIRSSQQYSFDLLYIPKETSNVTWWRVEIPEHPLCAMVIGIASTNRLHHKKHIFRLAFTCFVRTSPGDTLGLRDPFWYEEDSQCPYIQDCIEAAAYTQKCDILIVTNQSTCGDPFLKHWANVHLIERKRKQYFYNWNHPSLLGGAMLWPV